MALPPLPASNTPRYKLKYSVGGFAHTMTMRVSSGILASSASSAYASLLAAMAPTCWNITVQGLEFAELGSDVFNPRSYDGAPSFGLGTGGAEQSIRAASLVGRTTGGRKVRVFVYGYKLEEGGNARTTTTENGDIASVVTLMNTFTEHFLAIDGLIPTWRNYVNLDHNDHWVAQIRG